MSPSFFHQNPPSFRYIFVCLFHTGDVDDDGAGVLVNGELKIPLRKTKRTLCDSVCDVCVRGSESNL